MNNTSDQSNLLYSDLTFKIIGAAMEVHRELGHGFLEAIYHEALALELSLRNIPFESERSLTIIYKGKPLKKTYTADFICYDKILIEIKALSAMTSDHFSQTLNYLKATGIKVGLIINFGTPSLTYRRLIL